MGRGEAPTVSGYPQLYLELCGHGLDGCRNVSGRYVEMGHRGSSGVRFHA